MKNKRLLLLAVLSLVIAGLAFGPGLSRLKQSLTLNRQLKEELKQLQFKRVSLEGIDRNLADERVKNMEVIFPSQKPVVQLMSALSQLAVKYNLIFSGINLQPGGLKASEQGLNDLKFGFKVDGNFTSILQFMKELERTAPLMKIDKISLGINTGPYISEAQTLVSGGFEVNAYFQAPPKSLGNITAPVAIVTPDDETVLTNLFGFTQFPVILPVAQVGKPDLFAAVQPEQP
jgi:Tfp pilus assembly protein PilO